MRAERLGPAGSETVYFFDYGFPVLLFLFDNPQIDHIARRGYRSSQTTFHKNDSFFRTNQTLSFCRNIVDANRLQPLCLLLGLS